MSEHPHFFVDRSLGRLQVPRLLRDAGWALTTLAEHYGIPADEQVDDVDWLRLAGERGWAVLMKDDRIRRRPVEIAALRDAKVHAFCIANANLRFHEQAELFLRHEAHILARCAEPGPTLDSLNKGGIRPILL